MARQPKRVDMEGSGSLNKAADRGLMIRFSNCATPAGGPKSKQCWPKANHPVHFVLLQVKDTATRMLTNFSVQAGTNDFYTAQRLFKDPGVKALPQVCTQHTPVLLPDEPQHKIAAVTAITCSTVACITMHA